MVTYDSLMVDTPQLLNAYMKKNKVQQFQAKHVPQKVTKNRRRRTKKGEEFVELTATCNEDHNNWETYEVMLPTYFSQNQFLYGAICVGCSIMIKNEQGGKGDHFRPTHQRPAYACFHHKRGCQKVLCSGCRDNLLKQATDGVSTRSLCHV